MQIGDYDVLVGLIFKDDIITDIAGNTWTNTNATFSDGVFGNQSINCDQDKYLTSDLSLTLAKGTDWTISFWNKKYNTGTYDIILGSSASPNYSVQTHDSGSTYIGVRINSNGYNISSTSAINLNTWTHIAVTSNSENNLLYLFVNGILQNSITQTSDLVFNILQIGKWSQNNGEYSGDIDDVFIFNNCLWTEDFDVPTRSFYNVLYSNKVLNYGGLTTYDELLKKYIKNKETSITNNVENLSTSNISSDYIKSLFE